MRAHRPSGSVLPWPRSDLNGSEDRSAQHTMVSGFADLPWTSGAVYSRQEALTVAAAEEAANAAERERRAALRADASRPLVWLDVAIRGEPIGRMEFVLFTKEAPRAAENFRALCTCEKGHAPEGHEGAGKAYCLKVCAPGVCHLLHSWRCLGQVTPRAQAFMATRPSCREPGRREHPADGDLRL